MNTVNLEKFQIVMNGKVGLLKIRTLGGVEGTKKQVEVDLEDDYFGFLATSNMIETLKQRLQNCFKKSGKYICDSSLIVLE